MRARFGTAGNPDGFYQAGKKQSKDMPPWLREQGLEAYDCLLYTSDAADEL